MVLECRRVKGAGAPKNDCEGEFEFTKIANEPSEK